MEYEDFSSEVDTSGAFEVYVRDTVKIMLIGIVSIVTFIASYLLCRKVM